MHFQYFLFIFIGLFAISAASFNWDWFMENRKARGMAWLLGSRERARVFYILLGLLIAGMGFLGMLGVLDVS